MTDKIQGKTCKIGVIQMSMLVDVKANCSRALALIHQGAQQGAQIICLPELFCSQYFCQQEDIAMFDLAESIPGPTTELLAQAAKQYGVVVVGSIFERRAAGIYHNTAVVFDVDGTLVDKYRKMHIPDDPLYYEKFYFTPGDLGFKAIQTNFGKIGALICWDQWFPEAARLTAMQGAHVLCYPTAIGWHPSEKAEYGKVQVEAWEIMLRSHAIANGAYVIASNRFGHEGKTTGGIEFWGNSLVIDPFGRILAKASCTQEEILMAVIDYDLQEKTRSNWPFFRDRRIETYHDLTKRFML